MIKTLLCILLIGMIVIAAIVVSMIIILRKRHRDKRFPL